MDFSTLFEALKVAGLPGLVLGVAVCAFVYVGEFTGLLKNGWMKRLAVVLGSVLFSGLQAGEVFSALTAAIAALVAGLIKLGIDAGTAGIKAVMAERKAKK